MQLAPRLRTVDIAFVFEDGCVKVVPVEWHRGMTVLEALMIAHNKPHGIHFKSRLHRRRPRGPFVYEIDGQANDGSGGWMYWVNAELASRGCGEYVLKHGDNVRWEFVPSNPT